MCGAILPLPNTPSWRGAQLKKAQGLYLYQACSREAKEGRFPELRGKSPGLFRNFELLHVSSAEA